MGAWSLDILVVIACVGAGVSIICAILIEVEKYFYNKQ